MHINTDLKSWSGPRQIVAGCAAVTFVAAFLPWVAVLGISVSGWTGGDGKITAFLGVVGLVMAFAWWSHAKAHGIVQLCCGLLVSFVGLYDMTNFAAIGIYLTLLAGIVWAVASVLMLRRRPGEAAATPIPAAVSQPTASPPEVSPAGAASSEASQAATPPLPAVAATDDDQRRSPETSPPETVSDLGEPGDRHVPWVQPAPVTKAVPGTESRCQRCSCRGFVGPSDGIYCMECGHPRADHVPLSATLPVAGSAGGDAAADSASPVVPPEPDARDNTPPAHPAASTVGVS
jgi:hypothetical protein